jgi:hypothetical protein
VRDVEVQIAVTAFGARAVPVVQEGNLFAGRILGRLNSHTLEGNFLVLVFDQIIAVQQSGHVHGVGNVGLAFDDLESGVGTIYLNFAGPFDFIAGNPPWGAENKLAADTTYGKVKDTFSLFTLKAYDLLKKSGRMSFLLPQAILSVKSHKNMRSFLLNGCCLEQIEYIAGRFSGVMTGFVNIILKKDLPCSRFLLIKDGWSVSLEAAGVFSHPDLCFCGCSEWDNVLLDKIKQQQKYDLSESTFAL